MENPVKHSQVPAVKAIQLGMAQEGGEVDSASAAIIAKEKEYIREGDPLDNLNGLASSGGGIRSATFALGVIQALAHHDLLKKFDYLSTVSGGGYIGSTLTWLLSGQANAARTDGGPPFDADKQSFPFGTDKPGRIIIYSWPC